MKQIPGSSLKSFLTLVITTSVQTILWAQEATSGSSSTTTTKTTTVNTEQWFASPWVWVVGAAVFILLLVALLRGGSNSGETVTSRTDKVTVTKSSSID